jgi:hypothetical protein
MYCPNCKGWRTPCQCGRRDNFTARYHCRDCGYELRDIRPGDRGFLVGGTKAWWDDRERYHKRVEATYST